MRQCYRGHSYGYNGYGNQTISGVPQTLLPAQLTAVTVLLRLYGNQALSPIKKSKSKHQWYDFQLQTLPTKVKK